jgi:hypothetical protein
MADSGEDRTGQRPTPREIRATMEYNMEMCRAALAKRLEEYEEMIVAYETGKVDFDGFIDLTLKHEDKWGDRWSPEGKWEFDPKETKEQSRERGEREAQHLERYLASKSSRSR